jgi:hypothetical protein
LAALHRIAILAIRIAIVLVVVLTLVVLRWPEALVLISLSKARIQG